MKPSIEPVNLLRIHENESNEVIGCELWHPINGKWVHIYQDNINGKFYTDGKKE